MKETLFAELRGETLSAVVFVADYLQLDSNGSVLTSYVWPTVLRRTCPTRFEDPGYRDALCAFIGHDIESTDETPEAGLVIRFPSGSITIDPGTDELVEPEIALLQIHAHTGWMVWRPGEGIFAGRDWPET
ncbi:hypothetical protein [Saccharomonospora iraqiensis]|uniref:hypothetical protein n=1 Tax=Saccharomonospora iraqiensis TaxID=52698 RepID=UPI000408D052|nr:hypothetical protein [Saccharomonospora iraqiensis]